MAIEIQSTKGAKTQGVKFLVYGQAGAGKTTLIKTLPNPVVLSAEGGLLSLAGDDIPFVEVKNMEDLQEAYEWLTTGDGKDFESVALDSISEIAEVVLTAEKKATKDPRAAYGAMQDRITALIRAFRDIPGKHVYFSAKAEKSTDELGKMLWSPSMPGNKIGQSLPYFFDIVMALRVEKTEEGTMRMLLTDSDGTWTAKDRSGRLDNWEEPDLGAIIKKVQS